MNKKFRDLLLLNKSWPMRIWMWTAIICVLFYLLKFSINSDPTPTVLDMVLMTYGLGSIAVYTLIYGFDWS